MSSMSERKKGLSGVIAILAVVVAVVCRPTLAQEARDTGPDRWAATDALGRTLPGFAECGPTKPGKFVAIFYFLWLDREIARKNTGLFDIAKLTAANPSNPAWGPPGMFHFWGEPHFGYYLDDDDFVIRKHAQMLSDAGVDAIAFDVTNGLTYDENFQAVCRAFDAVRKQGGKTPQFFFLANAQSPAVVKHVYEMVYAKNAYPDLWFRWKGKPLLLTPKEELGPEIQKFFEIRQSWAWSDPNGWFGNGKDKWTWVDNTPQKAGWHDDPGKPEQISVAVAQHPVTNIGRSYQAGKQPPPEKVETEKGLYFTEQWKRARGVDPELVFVTGWNEWIAQRFVAGKDGESGFLGRPVKKGETYFVDQYSQEFSRDIEPMRGGHGDDYYYQLAAEVRRYKGVREPLKASVPKSILLARDFSQWNDVGPEYLDDLGDTTHRRHASWGSRGEIRYVNTSGRNDIESAKVARDNQNVYFYVRTREPLKSTTGLWLLIDVDADRKTGWEGYDFRVNRENGSVERNLGGWKWKELERGSFGSKGRECYVTISRELLGLKPGPVRIDFKWVDNVPDSGDILDFIDKGDVAPNGRFNYRYETTDAN